MALTHLILWPDGSEREDHALLPREEPHLHERFELLIALRSPLMVAGPAGKCWVPSSGAALIGPGVVHRVLAVAHQTTPIRRYYVSLRLAGRLFPERETERARSLPVAIDGHVARDWALKMGPLQHADYVHQPASPAPLTPTVEVPHEGLATAVRHLEQNLQRTVSLDELSRVCGLSKFHLCRVFHRAVGVTPRTYHRHIRLERGRRLLHEGRPASKVASDLNFADQSHFIRSFRKQFGTTPGEFLQARRIAGAELKSAAAV